MASVTYGKCYLWQKYYVKCNYGKNIMANETEPGEGGVPLPKKMGGFYGLTSHGFDQLEKGEREHYLRQKRREEKRK